MNSRIFLSEHPYSESREGGLTTTGDWPCAWISPTGIGDTPHVAAYRLNFTAEKEETIRIHVSADERYTLYLNGEELGRGPERGAPHHWFFETYEINLTPGKHTLVGRVLYLGAALRPHAQMSVYQGFLLSAEGDWAERIGTGNAPWESKELPGYEFTAPVHAWGSGATFSIDAEAFAWGHERGEGENWCAAEVRRAGCHPDFKQVDVPDAHIMQPAMLPPMMYETCRIGAVRFIESIDETGIHELASRTVQPENDLLDEKEGWTRLLHQTRPLTIPSRTRRRVVIDLDEYYCAYPNLTLSGGKGAFVRLGWAEAFYEPWESGQDQDALETLHRPKGNRDELAGKCFVGENDIFLPNGETGRTFEPPWWQAGRYLQFVIETADAPLVLEDFHLKETRYPLEVESSFESSDTELQAILPLMKRSLLTNAHETWFDCPYYEQMMYTGDTRLEILVSAQLSRDTRLIEKAIELFNVSLRPNGLTQARYPTKRWVNIPPFALYWTNMVHDHALWQNHPSRTRQWLPSVRTVLDHWWAFRNPEGLVVSPHGWNFVDWIKSWPKAGIPFGGNPGEISSILNSHLAYSLVRAAELEDSLGETELAQLQRRRAAELMQAVTHNFWNKKEGLFADDLAHEHWSEHAQCFALLSGLLNPEQREGIRKALGQEKNLAPSTIYFSHYYLEVCRELERMDIFFDRLRLWKELPGMGLKTTYEMPGTGRSDNHGWGAHPLYHNFASILGIRPAAMGYRRVHIKPQLGSLTKASGKAIHPAGFIEAAFRREGEKLTGTLSLPAGIGGTLEINGQTIELAPGTKNLVV